MSFNGQNTQKHTLRLRWNSEFADGEIETHESVTMVVIYFLYLVLVIFSSAIRESYRVNVLGRAARVQSSFVTSGQEALNPAGQDDSAGAQNCATPGGPTPIVASPLAVTAAILDSPVGTPRDGAIDGSTPLQLGGGHTPLHTSSTTGPSFNDPSTNQPLAAADSAALTSADAAEPTLKWHEQPTLGGKASAFALLCGHTLLIPLRIALRFTCPECAHDGPTPYLYPITFVTAFSWVAFMSTVIAAVVSRWGEMLCIPSSFLGMCAPPLVSPHQSSNDARSSLLPRTS